MSSEPEKKQAKPVSMSKSGPTHADEVAAERPRTVVAAVAAMGGSGLFAFGAAIALYGQRDWLTRTTISDHSTSVSNAVKSAVASASSSKADVGKASASASASATKHFPLGASGVHHSVSQQQQSALIGTIIVAAALAVLGASVYRGRYWSRWGVVGFWFLASFTGTLVGIGSLLSVGASGPAAFKVPTFLAGALLAAALVLVNMRSSTAYFALSRPAPREGAPARRGLFAPRVPPEPATRKTSTAASRRTSSAPAARNASTAVSTDPPVVEVSSTARTRRPATSGPSTRRCSPCAFSDLRTTNASTAPPDACMIAVPTGSAPSVSPPAAS